MNDRIASEVAYSFLSPCVTRRPADRVDQADQASLPSRLRILQMDSRDANRSYVGLLSLRPVFERIDRCHKSDTGCESGGP